MKKLLIVDDESDIVHILSGVFTHDADSGLARRRGRLLKERLEEPAKADLADKLDILFRVRHPPDRSEYTLDEVVEGIRRQGGEPLSRGYLLQLRSGLKDNPSIKHIQALARFFEVPPAYFLEGETGERIKTQLASEATQDPRVSYLALLASYLSQESFEALEQMAERLARLEGVRVRHDRST